MLSYYAVWIAETQWFGSFDDIGFYDVALNFCYCPMRKHHHPINLPPPIKRRSWPANRISNSGPWSVMLGREQKTSLTVNSNEFSHLALDTISHPTVV
jgi:hypothetical protein